MNVIVDFKYGEPVIAIVFDECGNQFMKSELIVKIPLRPYYEPDNDNSCTKKQYLKWKDKVYKAINKAILKSLNEHFWGTVNTHVNMEKHHGL